jgi:transposase-like protein
MNPRCPNSNCHSDRESIIKDGLFIRKNDSKKIQRYRCVCCKTRFSKATFSLAKNQKKRRVNEPLRKLICNSVSYRNAARILKINYKTVERKVSYLAAIGRLKQEKRLLRFKINPLTHIQFDDLITNEHTKMKPLSVTIAVNATKGQKVILGAEVSQIAAFGHLAKKSVAKYGFRKSYHLEAIERLFSKIAHIVDYKALIESDEHKNYPPKVRTFFPKSKHIRYPGGRGCIAGQGELKKKCYDPLFAINHSCAMLRYGISRLIRKTWNNTKRPDRLQEHLDLFIDFYNEKFDYLYC